MGAPTRISSVGPPVAPCSRAPCTTHHTHILLPYSPPKLPKLPSFPPPSTPSLTLLPSDTTHWHFAAHSIIMAGTPSSSITISKPPPVTNVADPDPSAHHHHLNIVLSTAVLLLISLSYFRELINTALPLRVSPGPIGLFLRCHQ